MSGVAGGPGQKARFALRTQDGARLVIEEGGIRQAREPADASYDLGSGILHAGLVNPHDHLFLNHYPRLGSPPYPNAYAWGDDIHVRCAAEIRRHSAFPRREALLFGALKNLLGGVTTVVHHDPWDPALGAGFPIRVARVRFAHSLRFERDWAAAVAGDRDTRDRPLSMHLAEGIDDLAAAEVDEAHQRGLLDRKCVAVHLVGAGRAAIARLESTGTAVVWCPTSNQFLFGRSAPRELFEAELDVLLGSDSLLTADGTMLAELRAARRLGCLDDARLSDAVGRTAARRLGLPEPSLAPGRPADIVFLRRPLFEARPADVALVLVGGVPRMGDAALAQLFQDQGVPVEPLDVAGVAKLVAAPLATVAAQVFERSPECRRILEA